MGNTTPPKSLGFDFDAPLAELFVQLMDAVREAGHARPSQKTLVQALIHGAPRDGATLEAKVLVPYRLRYEDAE